MTPRQRSTYWNLWKQVLIAHDWTTLPKAEQDDLRHQAHASVNRGRTFSSTTATNPQITLIFAEFKRLAGGGSLQDGIQLTAGEKPQRGIENPNLSRQYRYSILNRILPSFIGVLPPPDDPISYCERIMRDKFHTTALEHLNTWDLFQLVCTLTRCQKDLAAKAKTQSCVPEPATASNPF